MRTANFFWRWRGLLRGLLMVAVALLAVWALVAVLVVLEGRRDDLRQAAVARVGAAIVLAAGQVNGAPSAALQARLDHAIDLYRRGQVRQIVVTGGAAGEGPAEAAGAREYLLARGLPPEALLAEQAGVSTWQNLQNSLPLARDNNIQTVVLVSDPAHMLRALKMARDLGFTAYSSPAPDAGGPAEQAGDAASEALKYLVYLFARR